MKQAISYMAALSAITLVFTTGLTGCATFGAGGDDGDIQAGETRVMETDPVLIRAVKHGDETVMEHLSAEEVFERGYYAFQARRYEEAVENYELIVEYFEESRFFLPALYNGGLAYERMEKWDDAARFFQIVVDRFADTDEGLNAQFRLAQVHMELGKFAEVVDQLSQLLDDRELSFFDRVEARVLQGLALLELDEWDLALESFQAVRDDNLEQPRRERLEPDHRFMVMANFGMGRANHGLMNEIPLVLPPERMKIDLERKAEFHQDAQIAYIRALREHHPKWSVASGYKIGRLYQDFYMDIFVAEIPDDLSDEELAMYFRELRKQTQVLMDKGLRVYERNLSFSRRIARDDQAEEWVDATALHMERMRAFLEDPLVQSRAERLVVEGGDLEELWDTSYYAREHVGAALREAMGAIGVFDDDDAPDQEGDSADQQASGDAASDELSGAVDVDVHHSVAVQKGNFLTQ